MHHTRRLFGYLELFVHGSSVFAGCAALILAIAIALPANTGVAVEQNNLQSSELARAAQSKKADEMLSIASVQIEQHMYNQAKETLDQCRQKGYNLSSSQKKRFDKCNAQVEKGLEAHDAIDAAITTGNEHVKANQFSQAAEQFEKAYDLRKYMPETTTQKVKDQIAALKLRQKQQKKQMKELFKASVKRYKADDLANAQSGFMKIKDSGVKLGFFDRGADPTDTDGYLNKIAAKIGSSEKTAQLPQADEGIAVVEEEPPAVISVEVQEAPEIILVETVEPDEPTSPATNEHAVEQIYYTEQSDQELTDTIAPTEELAELAPVEQDQEYATDRTEATVAKQDGKKDGGFTLWPFGKKQPPQKSAETIEKINILLAQGDLAMEKGNYQLAREYFGQVLQIDAEIESAQRGMAAAEYNLRRPATDRPGIEPTILDRIKAKQYAQIEYIEASFITARNNINQMLAANRFESARAEVTQVRANIEGAKQLLGAERYERLLGEAAGMLDVIDRRQEEFGKTELQKQMDKARKEEQGRQQRAGMARQQKVDELFQRALAFRQAREFEQAVTTLQRLLELDQKHDQATLLLEDMKDLLLYDRQLKTARQADIQEVTVLHDARESSIPWSDTMKFSDDWVELTERRRKMEKQKEYAGGPVKRTILEKMDTVTVSPDYIEADLQQVIEDLRSEANLNIFVAWGDLEIAGIYPADPVTIQLNEVSARKALSSILEYASGGKLDRAGFIVDEDGVVNINSESVLGEGYDHEVQVYYVADLLERRAEGAYGGMLGGGGGGGGRGGGGGSTRGGGSNRGGGGSNRGGGGGGNYRVDYIMPPSLNGDMLDENAAGLPEAHIIETQDGYVFAQYRGGGGRSGGGGGGMDDPYSRAYELIDLIVSTVQPITWSEDALMSTGTGSTAGRRSSSRRRTPGMGVGALGIEEEGQGMISFQGGDSLVVFQTPDIHNQIAVLLEQLRATRGNQVSIEARILLISNNFLEDIGLDADFYLELGNAGYMPTDQIDPTTGRNILQPTGNGGHLTPISARQDSFGWAGAAETSVPGTLGGAAAPSAFSLSGSFLDNIQVDFLMRATQAHQRSRSLVAPHVTVMNGEDAYIAFFTEFSYVASLEAVVDNAVGLYTPVPAQAISGVELIVTPTISKDKRYVFLNIEVAQNFVQSIDSFEFNTAGGAGVDVETGTGTQTQLGTTSTASTGRIQQPVIDTNEILTHVAVPDGGTLLLGGQKLTGEIERESGVPGLSKLPILNRLFANRSTTKDERVLLLLITPQIILPAEKEELRFGDLTNTTGAN